MTGGIREIPLKGGKVAIVDADEWWKLASFRKWYFINGVVWAHIKYGKGGVALHRHLMNPEPWQVVDHIDGNRLNNCQSNLRCVSIQQNRQNSHLDRDNRSGFKGIYTDKGRWSAKITVQGRRIYLGRYKTQEEAARAYDRGARKHFGAFARLNFPIGGEQPARRQTA